MPWERKTVDEKRKEFVARGHGGGEYQRSVPRVWDQPAHRVQVDRTLPERGRHVRQAPRAVRQAVQGQP